MIAFNGGSFALRNKIINGDVNISQRGSSFNVDQNTQYTLDRWVVSCGPGSGLGQVTQSVDVPPDNEFQNSLKFTTNNAQNANTQNLSFYQIIEGYNVRDLIGSVFTISFWVKSNKIGSYTLCLNNNGDGMTPNKSYLVKYNINGRNVWEKKIIQIPVGLITTGTWNWTTGRGLKVTFSLAGGALNSVNTFNQWLDGNYESSQDQVNLLDLNANYFNITGVQLERGVTATPFEHRLFGTELSLCQRYYEKLQASLESCDVAGIARVSWIYKVSKRITPTVTFATNTDSPTSNTGVGIDGITGVKNLKCVIASGSEASAEL
jgi:hypothetical protein